VFAVQLARLAGARVIGTGSTASSDFLRGLGAEPAAYGDGLADRVRALAPDGVTAAIDLHGTETVHAARELGVPDARICTIAAQVDGVSPAKARTPSPAPWKRSPAWSRRASSGCPSRRASRSSRSVPRPNFRPADT
jgi:NADPH:quinone reductase-like Zn-dependent oxidoreductase